MAEMKRLSDFEGEKGIEIAAKVLGIIMEMMADTRNQQQKEEKNPLKMFSAFMANSPKKMMEIFAVLSETPINKYEVDGAEAMKNMLILANDPLVVGLFISQGRSGDAKSSGSASENTTE